MHKGNPPAENGFIKLARAACAMIKRADGFEYISDVPVPGGHFANPKLEHDYQMKNPMVTTLHPGIYGGAAVGAGVGRLLGNLAHDQVAALAHTELSVLSHPTFAGAIAGGILGLGSEAVHRYQYLAEAKQKLENGENPVDARYRV